MVTFSFTMLLNNLVFSSTTILIIFILKKSILKNASEKFNYYIWFPLNILMLFPLQITIVKQIKANTLQYKVANIVNRTSSEFNIGETIQSTSKLRLTPYIPKIYILIAIVLILVSISRYIIEIVMLIKSSYIMEDNKINNIFENELKKLKIKKYKPLRVSDSITTPINIGIFKPRIVLPSYMYSTKELELIFKHELTHYVRSDFHYKFLVMINKCIYWCNPLVYLMNKDISYTCETSCDREVVKLLERKEEIKEYGLIIIKTDAKEYKENNTLVLGLSNRSITKKRVELLFSKNRREFGTKSIAIASTMMIVVFLLSIITISTDKINSNATDIIKSIVKLENNSDSLLNDISKFQKLVNSEEADIENVSRYFEKINSTGNIELIKKVLDENNADYNVKNDLIEGSLNNYSFKINYDKNICWIAQLEK